MSSVSSTSSTSSTSSGGAVTFSGLASGVDTASIIDSIIKVESKPKTILEDKKTSLSSELDTYKEFKTLLEDFNTAVSGLNNETDLNSYQVTNNGSDYFSVSTSSLAKEGTYSVKVISLAQQQKDVSTNAISGWYGSDTRAQVQSFKTADGYKLDSQLSQLVSAMAGYAANHAGFNPATATLMPTDTTLQTAVAASWHK